MCSSEAWSPKGHHRDDESIILSDNHSLCLINFARFVARARANQRAIRLLQYPDACMYAYCIRCPVRVRGGEFVGSSQFFNKRMLH